MTAQWVVAIIALVVGTAAVGAVIVAVVRRWLDWSDRRSYVPPATLHTVRPAPLIGEVVWGGRTWADRNDSPQAAASHAEPVPVEAFRPDGAALAILVALIAQAAEHEARVQRALFRAPAPIWCQVTAEMELVKAGAKA